MDVTVALKRHNQSTMPKLRKNRRIDNKWGVKYHTAVKDAVFGIQSLPYMPSEPPPSLNGESEPLYVCKQCRDCFRFLSSFEDHNTRRSWILGFWCQHCFLTICTHVSSGGSPCPVCLKLDRDKRSYLRARGLHKSQKLGAIRVFYNQCQFFAHLKAHALVSVDMGDIMLMPLPTNIGNEWYSELDMACEALMEHAFLLRIHIMDWLKAERVDNNWWQLAINITEIDDNPVANVLKTYQGRHFFKTVTNVTVDNFNDLNTMNSIFNKSTKSDVNSIDSVSENGAKDKNCLNADSVMASLMSNENKSEDPIHSHASADIAFVDCGPTPKCFEPETPTNNLSRKHTTIYIKSDQDVPNSLQPANITKASNKRKKLKTVITDYDLSDISLSYGNTTITPKLSTQDSNKEAISPELWKHFIPQLNKGKMSIKVPPENNITKPGSDVKVNKTMNENVTNKEILPSLHADTPPPIKKVKLHKTKSDKSKQDHASAANTNSKILTFQSPKNITTIISQLSPHLVASKRIVFIGQDPDGVTVHNKQEASTQLISVVPDANQAKNINTVMTKVVPLHTSPESNKDTDKTLPKLQSEPKMTIEQTTVEDKVVYQNGRKYIIKHSPNTKNSSTLPSLPTLTKATQQQSSLESIGLNEPENTSTTQFNSLHHDVSPLTPSPSPSELSSSSSCETHSKQTSATVTSELKTPEVSTVHSSDFIGSTCDNDVPYEMLSFRKEEDEKLYLHIKLMNTNPKEAVADACVLMPKCKQEMLNEFYQFSYQELKKRIDHLEQVNEEALKVLNFTTESMIRENLKAINILQHALKDCIDKYNDNFEEINEGDMILNDWEIDFQQSKNLLKCVTCNKIIKPKSYIPAFSKLARDDDIYCPCYKYVCHECSTYQGDLTRFIAHRNCHEKEKPYMCPDCNVKFSSCKLLEVHMWTTCFHTLKRRFFGCKICQIDGFRDMESVTRHFVIMHGSCKIICETCFLVLSSYSEYKKHYEETHPPKQDHNPVRVVVCKLGQCIVRCENYPSHLEKHSGFRKSTWFKCPFCPFINLESTQATSLLKSHLQNKHLHPLSKLISSKALCDILPATGATDLLKVNSSISDGNPRKFVNAHEEPCEDGTIMPKIVNARTITSEVFERGAQEMDEDLTTDPKNIDSSKTRFKGEDKCDAWTTNLSGRMSPKILDVTSEVDNALCSPKPDKTDMLPKILDVRSIADLTSKNEQETSKQEEKNNDNELDAEDNDSYERELVIDEQSDKDTADKDKNATDNKLGENVPNMKTYTNASEKNDNLTVESSPKKEDSSSSELGKLLAPSFVSLHSLLTNNSVNTSGNTTTIRNNNTDGYLKVIDVHQMCQVSIEEGNALSSCAHAQEEVRKTQYMSSILKPPPLARIPQYVLDPVEVKKPKKEKKEEIRKESGTSQTPNNSKPRRKPLWRIALNEPIGSKDHSQDYMCHLCGQLVNTSWSVISGHFKTKHATDYKLSIVTPRLLRISSDFINGGYKDLYGNRKRKSDNNMSIIKRRRRWTPKKYMESKNPNAPGLGLCVQQETAEDGEGNFRCKKCNQRCTDMSDLREHIASNHRIKGRYLICLECGENFVVAPSLQMHLKAFHGIEDPITYMSRNTLYAPDVVDDLEGEAKTTVANQCHVCMAVFEDKAAVDKHLRVHGMAFLNRKRIEARNALKSPGKKEEDKQSPVKESPVKQNRVPTVPIKRENPAETILERIHATI